MKLVHFITMLKRWRVKLLNKQIVSAGKAYRKRVVLRSGLDAHVWPEEADYLDAELDRLDRRRHRLIAKLAEVSPL